MLEEVGYFGIRKNFLMERVVKLWNEQSGSMVDPRCLEVLKKDEALGDEV